MSKKIIIGSLSVVFLIIIVPSISAIEFNVIVENHTSSLYEKIQSTDIKEGRRNINGGYGLLELFIAFLLFLYIQLGIIFNRSFTLILLLADLLYEIGIRLGLIDPSQLLTEGI
jgi:hypothetical protein